ncbi:unnamed protein product (macronuclear) [Paramecium tetraurelia]|uniref:C2H2-type domain-containing protein n=1 Tax=Paramecium tetraurelia TaxID=5888 RepID=A0BZQ5_PARTE|nr:uncharacterized protein GSPATT00005874001 [Paramecium tetraurelia]CAK64022.1 unnamed protein product [Paramecium tetraurelia]|eukprot:XP_001431420.1 hypothetical protein (macronuclear) [Paramecium tetraurelia strain d4-2]
MNNIYQAQLTESNRKNYLKLVNLLQMIIFYNEYCNFKIKETSSQLDLDIEKIDQEIQQKEERLLKSKRRYQKCKIYKEELKKQLKLKPQKVYGCLHCSLEFSNTILLDRHMEIHKEPPNITPQIIAIQKELQQQLMYMYQAKQQRKQLELQKEDLKCGMLAAAERNQELVSNEKMRQIEKVYIEKVNKLETLLNQLNSQTEKEQYASEWLDNLEEGINEQLNLKSEQEKLLKTQIEAQQAQSKVFKSQRSLQTSKKDLRIPSNTSFKPQSQLYIQSQVRGSNHQFRRSNGGIEYASDDSPREEIILEEDDQVRENFGHTKNFSSATSKLKGMHSKNPSGVSFQESNLRGLTKFEQYEYRYQEFNSLVTEMLLNRYYLRRTQFDPQVIEKERLKLLDQFEDLDEVDDLEDLLKQMQKQTKGFEKRKRYQIKKKKLRLQDQAENEDKEHTITTLESSSENQESQEEKDEEIELRTNQQFELRKFPFKIAGGDQEQGNQYQQYQEPGQGYGVNTFSINY